MAALSSDFSSVQVPFRVMTDLVEFPSHSESEDEIIEPITEWPVTSNENLHEIHPISKQPLFEKEENSSNKTNLLNNSKNASGLKRKIDEFGDLLDESKKKCNGRDVVLARTALARWWRKEGKHLIPASNLPKTNNPNTLLHFISRCEPGVEFLRREREKLQNILNSDLKDGLIYAALGTVEECLGNLTEARKHLKKAIQLDSDNKDYKWHLHKIERQAQVQEHQEKMLEEISQKELKPKPVKQVKRVSANTLTLEEFFHSYALTSTPVVITDLVDRMTSTPWTMQHIVEVAGNVKVTLKKSVSQSVEWAGLEEGETVTVKEYTDQILSKGEKGKSGANPSTDQYLFDWSLPLHCPQLVKELSIPRYFAGDLLQRTSRSSLYQDSWPSLFVAPSGLCSQLHIDAFASNFWMALFQGKKRWTFYSPSDVPYLYPRYVYSMDPTFDVDILFPDMDKHPLFSLAQPVQCDLQEGEVLFVPSGCPHQVDNLEDSVAISANFVDLSNLEAVKQELKVSALIDPRSDDLLKQLQDPHFPSSMDSTIGELPWEQFKSWTMIDYEKHTRK